MKKIPIIKARASRQKKLSPERELRPGSAWVMLTKKIPAVSAGGKAENVLALNRKRLVATVSRKRARLQASSRAERDLFREGGARERTDDVAKHYWCPTSKNSDFNTAGRIA